MLRKSSQHVSVIVLTILSFFMMVISVGYASEMPFTVNTNIPDNQMDKGKTYFNLKVKPEQQQTVSVKLTNTTDQDITVNINVNSAKTNINGVVEYGKNNLPTDKSLKYDIKDLVTHPDSIVIPKKNSKIVPFNIKMPKDKYKGIILGGITFQQKDDEVAANRSSKGASVQNRYAYAVAMVLKETDDKETPHINLMTVAPGQSNARSVINAKIQNDRALLMKQVDVDAKIYASNATKPTYTSTTHDMQIAPNTHFNYPIALKGTEMKPGKYTLKLTVKGTAFDKAQTWHFTKDFIIQKEKARQLNQADVDMRANTNNRDWIYPIVGLLLLVIIIILVIIVIRQRKRRDQ